MLALDFGSWVNRASEAWEAVRHKKAGSAKALGLKRGKDGCLGHGCRAHLCLWQRLAGRLLAPAPQCAQAVARL